MTLRLLRVVLVVLLVAMAPSGIAADRELIDKSRGVPGAAGTKKSDVFIRFAMREWDKYYDELFRDRYPAPSKEDLLKLGRYTYKRAIDSNEENHTYIFALLFLNWRACMQGFGPEFIRDATEYVLNETGVEFGIRWYEYQIKQFAAQDLAQRESVGVSRGGLLQSDLAGRNRFNTSPAP